MKKALSLLLSIVMLISITAGIDFSSCAKDNNLILNDCWVENSFSSTIKNIYYKFTIPKDAKINLKLMKYTSVYYSLYNEDLSGRIHYTSRMDASADSPTTHSFEYGLSKGIYYIKISQDNNSNGGKIKLKGTATYFNNNETEPNDYENAMNLSSGKTITGALTVQDDIDWYKFIIPQKAQVFINITFYISDLWFDVYNEDLSKQLVGGFSVISGGSESSPKTETYNLELSKGTYFIKVSKHRNTGKYNLSWKLNINVSKPSKFKVSSRNTTSLKLAWNKVSGVSGYQLQRKSGNSWKTVATTTSTSCTVKSLKAGTAYAFRVRAYKTINGTKYYSGWRTLTTPTKPATVSFSSLKAGKKKFTAKWKKTACTGYQLQYSTSSKFKSAKTVTVGKNSTTSKTVSKLKGKKKYYVRVRAYKTVNSTKYYGAWSKAKTVKTK